MSKGVERFSDVLRLSPESLTNAGLLNQPLLKDDHFYIDIFKFKDTGVPEFKNSYENFLDHFNKFFKLLKASKRSPMFSLPYSDLLAKNESELKSILRLSDSAFRGAFNLLNFQEIDGFNLGYATSLHGASIGTGFKFLLINSAKELLDMNIDDPEVFCLLPFLQEGIGCDRVSDMFISINYKHFLKYTERKLVELGVTSQTRVKFDDEKYNLIKPQKFKNPLILVPRKFVKRLPTSIGWDDIFNTYDENSALRDKLNRLILTKYAKKSEVTKAKVAALLKDDPGLLKKIITEFKETTAFSKIEEDLFAEVEHEIETIVTPSLKSLKDKVQFILNKFKWFVENKGTWKLFYHKVMDESGEKIKHPLSEDHIQRAFHIVAELLAEKFRIDITPEADTGIGVVDFKFSDGPEKILVEVKLSTHKDIVHGFETQLSEYIRSENPEYSFFLVVILKNTSAALMNTDKGRLERLQKAQKRVGVHSKKAFYVDAQPKKSASKK